MGTGKKLPGLARLTIVCFVNSYPLLFIIYLLFIEVGLMLKVSKRNKKDIFYCTRLGLNVGARGVMGTGKKLPGLVGMTVVCFVSSYPVESDLSNG